MTLETSGPAIYANYFRLGYTASEFILECGQAWDEDEINMTQRVIFTPATARELHDMLGNSLLQHACLLARQNDEVG